MYRTKLSNIIIDCNDLEVGAQFWAQALEIHAATNFALFEAVTMILALAPTFGSHSGIS